MELLDNSLNKIFENNTYSSLVNMFLILYASLAAPNLPKSVKKIFKNNIFRIIIFTLILYQSNKNTTMSILIAICFAVSLQNNKQIRVEKFSQPHQYQLLTGYGGINIGHVNRALDNPINSDYKSLSFGNILSLYRSRYTFLENILRILHPTSICWLYGKYKQSNRSITDKEVLKRNFKDFLASDHLTTQYFKEFNNILNHINYEMVRIYALYINIPLFLNGWNTATTNGFKYDFPKIDSLLNERIFSNINNILVSDEIDKVTVQDKNIFYHTLPKIIPNKSTEKFFNIRSWWKNGRRLYPRYIHSNHFKSLRDINLYHRFYRLRFIKNLVKNTINKINISIIAKANTLNNSNGHARMRNEIDYVVSNISKINRYCEEALLPLFEVMNYVFYNKKYITKDLRYCNQDNFYTEVILPSNAHLYKWKY